MWIDAKNKTDKRIKINSKPWDKINSNLWSLCKKCNEMIYTQDLKQNNNICTKCNFYFPMSPIERINLIMDDGFKILKNLTVKDDPLKFPDYQSKLDSSRRRNKTDDILTIAVGSTFNEPITVAVMNFKFLGGSMGRAFGENFIKAVLESQRRKQPLLIVTSSGGARMFEGILSLMQMPRTSLAVLDMNESSFPFLVLFTDPTYGGTTASFAMLGDVSIAEKGARVGFAGREIIAKNTQEKLPDNFQTAEYLLEKGAIDRVSSRENLKKEISLIAKILMQKKVNDDIN